MAESVHLNRRGVLFVLSSPSGAGKTTISKKMLAGDRDIALSISATTRPMRPGEQDGVDYHFVDVDTFKQMAADGEFLEWAHVFGHRYGTPRDRVEELLAAGKDVLFDIDWQGAQQLYQEAGPDVELIVDAGCPWTATEAGAFAEELKAVRLKFLEEPLWPPENFHGLAELRRTTGIPISSGENASTLMEFDRMLAAGAVDFVQPSPAKMGGISELCKVFPLAAVHNIPMMTHSFYDGPGLLAALHATAALGNVDSMIEWRLFELEAFIYGDALTPKAGRISVPQGPGLGIDPDPDVISAYRRGTTP